MTTYESVSTVIASRISNKTREDAFKELVALPLTPHNVYAGRQALLDQMIGLDLPQLPEILDVCGTGGSGFPTINTSTLVAFVANAAGAKVAKHCGKSASGKCGSMDVLDKLGIKTMLSQVAEEKIFKELGLLLINAGLHHPGLSLVSPLRKAHGRPTIFNILGPLCNPAKPTRRFIGVSRKFFDAMKASITPVDATRTVLVSAEDETDEIGLHGITKCFLAENFQTSGFDITMERFGLPEFTTEETLGGDSRVNAETFKTVLCTRTSNAHTQVVLVNSAVALWTAGVARNFQDGYALAHKAIFSGKAYKVFEAYRKLSNELAFP